MRLRLLLFVLLLGAGSALGSLKSVQREFLAPWCAGEAFVSEKLMHLSGSDIMRSGLNCAMP